MAIRNMKKEGKKPADMPIIAPLWDLAKFAEPLSEEEEEEEEDDE